MQRAWLPALVALVIGCKGDKKEDRPARQMPVSPPSAPADAALIGSELKFVGCAPAQAAPGIAGYGQIGGRGRAARPGEGFGVPPSGLRVGGPAVPKVRRGALKTTGPLPRATIASTIATHANRLQYCYEQSLVRTPITGSLVLTATLEPTGSVFEAGVENSFDDELSLCLKHIISELRFPAAPKPARTTLKLPLTFAWQPPPPTTAAPEPTAWTPFAASATRPPLTVAGPAAAQFPPAMSLGALQKCLGTTNGSFRSVMKLGIDGSVIAARTGGLGNKDAEACISSTLVGTKGPPVPLVTEIACDFQRGDATPWRVSPDAGYTVIEPGKEHVPAPTDAAATFLVVLEPTTPADIVAKALEVASRGAASIVALKIDDGAPLYVAAGAHLPTSSDPSTPFTVDTNEPISVCGGLLEAPVSGPLHQADVLIGKAARRCTHRPCPAVLAITTTGPWTAKDLAALAGAARGLDFERIVLGPGSCPR